MAEERLLGLVIACIVHAACTLNEEASIIRLAALIVLCASCVPSTLFGQSSTESGTAQQRIIPADRVTTWNPGLNAMHGIPDRTTIYQTLSPRGGSLDDTATIQSALDTCP